MSSNKEDTKQQHILEVLNIQQQRNKKKAVAVPQLYYKIVQDLNETTDETTLIRHGLNQFNQRAR